MMDNKKADEIRSKWDAVFARISDEGGRTLTNNKSDGICIITMHVVVDVDGSPIVWTVPKGVRIEPTRSAKEILLSVLSSDKFE